MRNIPNLNILWSSLIVEELIRNGVEYFCISSGSRSSALTLAVADHPKAKAFVHFDERASAFHAMGYAAGSGKPAVIITTSGTAVANCLPAVIEASKKKLPLIILTADRPPELMLTGAHQTIDHQVEVFGKYVRWSVNMPCPTQEIDPAYVLTTVDQAIFKAKSDVKGPVHINCAFREPLGFQRTHKNFDGLLRNLKGWLASNKPFTRYSSTKMVLSEEQTQDILSVLRGSKKGVIAVGKLGSQQDFQAVLKFSEKLGWPVFPDVTSGLRLVAKHKNVIPYYDQLLLSDRARKFLKVDCVVQFGGRMTSKRFYRWLEETRPKEYIMVLNHSLRHDPLHNVTQRVQSSAKIFVDAVLTSRFKPAPENFVRRLSQWNVSVEKNIEKYFFENRLNEITAARLISRLTADGSNLFLGNSMPLRDMDMYAVADKKSLSVSGNRGASGIDGHIASAAGYAVGSGKPTTLVLGDLAFLYDLNALSMLEHSSVPVIVVVVNNQGGGIFSFLPIAENNHHFEKFWGTPHNLSFKASAEQFGLPYAVPSTLGELGSAYQDLAKSGRSGVIEIITDRADNVREHRTLQSGIKRNLDKI